MPSNSWFLIVLLLTFSAATSIVPADASGYLLESIRNSNKGELVGELKLITPNSTYGPDIITLQLTVSYEHQSRLRVHITDATTSRWEVPTSLVPRLSSSTPQLNKSSDLQFSYTPDPFTFSIIRKSTKELLFSSTPGLTFTDQYLEISTTIPSNASLFGLGESTRPSGFKLTPNSTYSLWASDTPSTSTDKNLYASWPFYLDVRTGGASHGVFLLNSNAMDVEYSQNLLTYKTIGGVLDFTFFAGPSPASVVEQLTDMVGKPAPMPYWSLGFHQCRYGYKNVEELREVVANYSAAGIPLEVMWTDIDYMDAFKDFTLDPVNFPRSKMQELVNHLHANDQKYVVIIDPGIKVEKNYSAYERGRALNIFINDIEGKPYLGQVWPGPVHFPDFLNPRTSSYWRKEISEFLNILAVDGLWIDMNEASNFCTGVTCSLTNQTSCGTTCCLLCSDTPASKWDNPPYPINNNGVRNKIGSKTMAASAAHYNGVLEYDAHNLYGLAEAIATEKALRLVTRKRPFILSRSTFVGSGRVTAHWSGDNGATWEDLRFSIVSILNSGLVGMPMAGADICGFIGNTTEELCNRWIQAGAFYPFSRDHNDDQSTPQELYRWESVTKSARKVLKLRYQLLPHLYTLAYEAHTTGKPIARPIFFSFPGDGAALGVDTQFMLGDSILVSPVLSLGATSVEAYFPRGMWYSLFNFSQLIVSTGSSFILRTPLDSTNVHVRGGVILPMQREAMTTASARKSPFTLLVALSDDGDKQTASGSLFLDSGDDLDMKLRPGSATLVRFTAKRAGSRVSIKSHVQLGEFALTQKWVVNRIVVLGVKIHSQDRQQEFVNGKSLLPETSFESFDAASRAEDSHEFTDLNLPLGSPFHISLKTASYQ